MKVKQQSNRLNLTVVALVALVAIVGLVTLVLNAASLTSIPIAAGVEQVAAQENLAGSAFGVPDQVPVTCGDKIDKGRVVKKIDGVSELRHIVLGSTFNSRAVDKIVFLNDYVEGVGYLVKIHGECKIGTNGKASYAVFSRDDPRNM